MTDVTQGHTVHSYNADLQKLRAMVLGMGRFVTQQVRDAERAMLNADFALARDVIDRGTRVNEYDLAIDDQITDILALRQPVGIDLRLVRALGKAVTDLERVGDEAEKIGWCSARLYERESDQPKKRLLRHVGQMSQLACRMLDRSLHALQETDYEEALQVIDMDVELDDEFDAAMRHLVTFMLESPSNIGRILDVVFALKSLERIGDHAKNISEYIIYVVKGKDVRHRKSHRTLPPAIPPEHLVNEQESQH